MDLVITTANDVTSDLLCERLDGNVLRINFERWTDYFLDIHAKGFRIADSFGREVTQSNLGNIIWRKPLSTVDTEPGESWYAFHEFKYAVHSIIDSVRRQNPRRLPIDPAYNATIDKFAQLRAASTHLPIPDWHFTCQPSTLEAAKKLEMTID